MASERISGPTARGLAGGLTSVLILFTALVATVLVVVACSDGDGSEFVKTPDPEPKIKLLDFGKPIDDFSFLDHNGEEFTRDDLLGKIWIVDFVFTNCPGACPIMTDHLRSIGDQLRDLDQVRMLSITVDPKRDVPGVLKRYAESKHCDLDRWVWLTGERAEIYTLCTESFLLPGFGDIQDDGDIPHTQKFVILDQRAHIRAYHEEIELMENDVVSDVEHDVRLLIEQTEGS